MALCGRAIWWLLTFASLAPGLGSLVADSAGDQLTVVRLQTNPIIRPEMLPNHDGDNINGPSLIRVPSWLPNPLGAYYLYFAHHGGKYIRLAYADRLEVSGSQKLGQEEC